MSHYCNNYIHYINRSPKPGSEQTKQVLYEDQRHFLTMHPGNYSAQTGTLPMNINRWCALNHHVEITLYGTEILTVEHNRIMGVSVVMVISIVRTTFIRQISLQKGFVKCWMRHLVTCTIWCSGIIFKNETYKWSVNYFWVYIYIYINTI